MWLGKFMAKSGIKGYNVLLREDMKTPVDGADETKIRLLQMH